MHLLIGKNGNPVGTNGFESSLEAGCHRSGGVIAMDVQPVSLNTLLVQCRELHRQMAEVLELRAKVASVEKSGVRPGSAAEKQVILVL
jgi:hypothetical protein